MAEVGDELAGMKEAVAAAGREANEAAHDADVVAFEAVAAAPRAVQALAKAKAAHKQADDATATAAAAGAGEDNVLLGMMRKLAETAGAETGTEMSDALERTATAQSAYEKSAGAAEAAAAAATALSAKLPTPKARHLLITATQGHKDQARAALAAAKAAADLHSALQALESAGGGVEASSAVTATAAALTRAQENHEKVGQDAWGFSLEATV
jgi:hypothetical protein